MKRRSTTIASLIVIIVFVVMFAPQKIVGAPATATIIYYDYPPEIGYFRYFPHNITQGPDRNLWFTGWGSYLGRITPSDQVTAVYAGGYLNSVDIVSGHDNSLWFSESHGSCGMDYCNLYGYVGKFTLDGNFNEWRSPIGLADGLTMGPDGNIWFPSGGLIVRMTPTGDTQIFNLPDGTGLGQSRIVTGPDGNLWFPAYDSNVPAIGRMTTSGNMAFFPLDTNGNAKDIISGPDGNLWFTEYWAGKIGRITPSGAIKEFLLPSNVYSPDRITTGPDGNLWFIESHNNGSWIGRMTPLGVFDEFPVSNSYPTGITAGPDGNIWFVVPEARKIGKLDLGIKYTISGYVKDDNNFPIFGVTVSSSSGASTTTDIYGYYTLTNVPAGTYTITPSKSGYIFAPVTSTVSVTTANITGKDFRMRTLPPADFLDIPVTYSKFANALQGNTGGNTAWLVNSWFDHQSPNYTKNQNLVRWDRCIFTGKDLNKPGLGWYDGHNGIDFQNRRTNDPIYPAYGGTVKEVNRNWKDTPSICGSRGCPYGNYVLIDHGYGYASLYAHLDSVNPNINVGTQIASSRAITVGIMGGTGGYETHLHFGVYYDANGNGLWEETYNPVLYTEVVDPFSYRLRQGCKGPTIDPWSIPSRYLWRQDILPNSSVGGSGANLISPAGNKTVNIPAGALPSTLTIQFGDVSPVAMPSAQLRSTGQSFLLQVLEWLGITGQGANARRPNSSFTQPVTLQVTYGVEETLHLDTSQMKIYFWDEVTGAWSALQTTIDTNLKTATAQTIAPGNFDLQVPLLCPADTLEINDNYYAANIMAVNSTSGHLFDIAQDEDWIRFVATGGARYTIQTSNLSSSVDTLLQVYDIDGVTMLASDDNSGGGKASRLIWQAPQTGTYFVRVSQASGSAFGCGTAYQVSIAQQQDFWFFFPFIRK